MDGASAWKDYMQPLQSATCPFIKSLQGQSLEKVGLFAVQLNMSFSSCNVQTLP